MLSNTAMLLAVLSRTSRPYFWASLAALLVCSGLAAFATLRAARAVDEPFAGFVWQQHGDHIAVSVMTSSSWQVMDVIRWGALLSSLNGVPAEEVAVVPELTVAGETFEAVFRQMKQPVTLEVETFTWEKLVESFGVFLAGGLLFGASGVFLVHASESPRQETWNRVRSASSPREGATPPARNLSRLVGAALLLTSVLVLSGLGEASVSQSPPALVSILCDLLWSAALALVGPIFLLLAEAVSPGFIPSALRSRPRTLLLAGIAAWPFCFVLLRTTWGLEVPRSLFLYISLFGGLVLVAGARTLIRPHWLRSPTHTAAYVVSAPLTFTLLLFVVLAVLPWALGREFVLPSSVMIPVGCLIPLTLVYSALAGTWLAALKTRVAESKTMLERQKVSLASIRLLLHDQVLADLKSLRADLGLGSQDQDRLPSRLLAIEGALRAQLATLDSDRAYDVPEAFPSSDDIRDMVSQIAPGTNLELELDELSEQWPPLVRWMFYCHLSTLIRNARIHGRAENISIRIVQDDGEAVLVVDDDGLGFSTPSSQTSLTAIGLRAAQRDIEEEGGRLTLGTSPNGGARIEERLPLPS